MGSLVMKKVEFSTVLVFTTLFFQFHQLSALEEKCSDIQTFKPNNLTFPGGKISPLSNLTWGINEFGDYLECIDKFVVLYDWNNVSGIMCPSFNISKINSTTFQCPVNLTHLCNETINVEFETWTLDKKFLKNGPFGRVFLNCSSLIEEIIPEKNSQKSGLSE